MLAPDFGDGGIDVAVFAGIGEVVVVGGAANASAHVIKEDEGQLFEDHLRGQRGGKAQRGDIGVAERRISLILMVAGERSNASSGRWRNSVSGRRQ